MSPAPAPGPLSQARRDAAMAEVRAAMAFYASRGWDWLAVVEFICWKGRA